MTKNSQRRHKRGRVESRFRDKDPAEPPQKKLRYNSSISDSEATDQRCDATHPHRFQSRLKQSTTPTQCQAYYLLCQRQITKNHNIYTCFKCGFQICANCLSKFDEKHYHQTFKKQRCNICSIV